MKSKQGWGGLTSKFMRFASRTAALHAPLILCAKHRVTCGTHAPNARQPVSPCLARTTVAVAKLPPPSFTTAATMYNRSYCPGIVFMRGAISSPVELSLHDMMPMCLWCHCHCLSMKWMSTERLSSVFLDIHKSKVMATPLTPTSTLLICLLPSAFRAGSKVCVSFVLEGSGSVASKNQMKALKRGFSTIAKGSRQKTTRSDSSRQNSCTLGSEVGLFFVDLKWSATLGRFSPSPVWSWWGLLGIEKVVWGW